MLKKFIKELYSENIILLFMLTFIISVVCRDGLEMYFTDYFYNDNFQYINASALYKSCIPQIIILFYAITKIFCVQDESIKVLKAKVSTYYAGILIFFLTIAISIIFSSNPKFSAFQFSILVLWRILSLFFITSVLLKEKESYKWCLLALVYSLALNSVYVFYQGLFQGNLRAYGFYWHPLFFAGVAITVEIICFYAIVFKLYSKSILNSLYVCMVINWGALVYNGSRGAWIAIVFSFIIMFFCTCKGYKSRYLKVACVLLLETIILFSSNMGLTKRAESIVTEGGQPKYVRYLIWESAFNMFWDHPVTGVGFGCFESFYNDRYGIIIQKGLINHAHNDYLHVLAENGVVGLCGFLTMFGVICWRHWQKLRKKWLFRYSCG